MSSKEAHGSCGHHHSGEHDHHSHDHHDHSDHSDHHDHSDHGHGHGDSHENMIYVGVLVLIGFLLFFIAEKIASSRGHSHSHSHTHEDVPKEQSSSPIPKEESTSPVKEIIVNGTSPEKSEKSKYNLRKRTVNTVPNDEEPKVAKKETEVDYKNGKDKNDKTTVGATVGMATTGNSPNFLPSFSKLSAAGWLNLLADSMHNFTDGIAIGTVSFGIILCNIT
jgi:zinc transporter ZupT